MVSSEARSPEEYLAQLPEERRRVVWTIAEAIRAHDAVGRIMADDDQYMRRHELKRSILDEMHAPIAYFIGGESDIAYPNAENDWQALQELDVTAINANMDVGHGATYQMPNGGPFASGPLAWLKWQLKDDAQARAMFVGEACGFCSGGEWSLRRHFPQ